MSNVVYLYLQDDSGVFTPDEITNIKSLLSAGKSIGNEPYPTFTVQDTNNVSYKFNNNAPNNPAPVPDPNSNNINNNDNGNSTTGSTDDAEYIILASIFGLIIYFLYNRYTK
jgi:hypothetical protein